MRLSAFSAMYLKRLANPKVFNTVLMMGLRGSTLVSKFALTFFIAKTMGLESLGLYGLIASGATLVPSLFGLGLNGPVNRHIVDMPLEEALPKAFSRMGITALLHAVALPLFLVGNMVLGAPLPPRLALLAGLVLVLENFSSDLHTLLIARHKAMLAAVLLFIRSGAWPLAFMAAVWLVPGLNTMGVLLLFWLVSLCAIWAFMGGTMASRGLLRLLHFKKSWILSSFRKAIPFYVQDIGTAGGLYLDRFLITALLGLEATGVYTFFWSMANAANALVYFGITQPSAPKLLGAAKRKNRQDMERHLATTLREVWAWSLGLAVALIGTMPVVLHLMHKPQLFHYQWIFWVMMAGTVLRTVSENYSIVLYAHRQDTTMTHIALVGMAASGLFVLLAAPLGGLPGVAFAALATAMLLFGWRRKVMRHLMATH